MKKLWFPLLCALLAALALFLRFALVGYSFSALVCFFLLAVVLCLKGLHLLYRHRKPLGRALLIVFTVLLTLGFLVVAVTESLVIRASFGSRDPTCDYVIVLGCLVKGHGPSASLQDRIDATYDYLTAHPQAIAILSGGKGEDEPVTEAQCMFDSLVARGIDPERLWLEEQATSTWTNLQYSLALLEERTGSRPRRVGILSSEYHLFRASLQARDQGLDPVLIPAKTSVLPQALNHFLREVAGVWHYILLGGRS